MGDLPLTPSPAPPLFGRGVLFLPPLQTLVPPQFLFQATATQPATFSVRLAGPDNAPTTTGTGRLQVYKDGVWGPVAGSLSGNLTALTLVACKQMGYASGIATAYSVYHAPQGSGQHMLSCTGMEANVSKCTYNGLTGSYDEVELACVAAGGELGSGIGHINQFEVACLGLPTVVFLPLPERQFHPSKMK